MGFLISGCDHGSVWRNDHGRCKAVVSNIFATKEIMASTDIDRSSDIPGDNSLGFWRSIFKMVKTEKKSLNVSGKTALIASWSEQCVCFRLLNATKSQPPQIL